MFSLNDFALLHIIYILLIFRTLKVLLIDVLTKNLHVFWLFTDDIPIQQNAANAEGSKPLGSICEDADGEDNKPIRPVQGSGREKDGILSVGSGKEKDGKDKMNFLPTNIPIPNIVKRKDKEKNKNGDKKDGEKKSEKKERLKQEKEKEKENRNGTNSNRNSAVINSDSDGGETVSILKSSQQPQQSNQVDMKIIVTNKNAHHIEIVNSSNTDGHALVDSLPDGEGMGTRGNFLSGGGF